MANLIIARDVQTKQFATISEDWLTRFPGEFEKVRDVLDPITEEEKTAEKTALESDATDRKAEIEAATKAAEKAAAEAGDGDASGSTGRNRF